MPMFIFVCSYAFASLCDLLRLNPSGVKKGNEIVFIFLLALALYRIPNFYLSLERDPRYDNYEPYKPNTEWLLRQPDIYDDNTVIIQDHYFRWGGLPFYGWIEYYVTKQGRVKAPNIHSFNNINVMEKKYNRIYLFYPRNNDPYVPKEINTFLDDYYTMVEEKSDLRIKIYDLKE